MTLEVIWKISGLGHLACNTKGVNYPAMAMHLPGAGRFGGRAACQQRPISEGQTFFPPPFFNQTNQKCSYTMDVHASRSGNPPDWGRFYTVGVVIGRSFFIERGSELARSQDPRATQPLQGSDSGADFGFSVGPSYFWQYGQPGMHRMARY